MPITLSGSIGSGTYSFHPHAAGRALKGATMPDLTPIVFVVDDDISVRESLELLLQSDGWRAETFASATDFLSHPRPQVPCCLVLDVTLPGVSGLDLQAQLAERVEMPIIFITGYGDVPMTVRAMKGGAVEFFTKPFSDDVLLEAIRAAVERSRGALQREEELRVLRDCYALLTPRERQVMDLVVQGKPNKLVGSALGLSPKTVEVHRANVMKKMEAQSLAELVRMSLLVGEEPTEAGGAG